MSNHEDNARQGSASHNSAGAEGKVVLIAGGAKNLGGLLARQYADQGARAVVIHHHDDRSVEEAERTAEAVRQAGAEALVVSGDLTAPSAITELFDRAVTEYGQVDIAVNTVGMVLRKPMTETTEAEYDQMFDINSKAAFFFIAEAGRKVADGGKVISVVTSLLSAFTDGYATYAGGKAPVEHFTRAAAKEFADRGISVTAVAPGPMDTPFFYGQETPERVEFHKSQAMGNQLTQIEDIAPIIEFLSGPGHWITGQTILANGGYTTR